MLTQNAINKNTKTECTTMKQVQNVNAHSKAARWSVTWAKYTVNHKNVPANFRRCFHQILTDFKIDQYLAKMCMDDSLSAVFMVHDV